MSESTVMEKIVALCKRRGFIFQSSEIYGGLNGFWDYGPLGAELKRNLREVWWKSMTRQRDDVVGLDASIIMHPNIWKASGHVDTFSDPMSDCLVTQKRFRSDQIQPQSGTIYRYTGANSSTGVSSSDPYSVLLVSGKNPESARKVAKQYYTQRGATEPELLGESTESVTNTTSFNPENGGMLTEPRAFNLMLETHVGPIKSDENRAYLRPETAQAIFAQYKNVLDSSRLKLPFGICQIGKAFRNEINPRNYTFRSREFEQMELEFFIKPDEVTEKLQGSVTQWSEGADLTTPQANWGWEMWHRYWVAERTTFYASIGLGADVLDYHWQKPEELAHYARACVDILFKFPFGTEELEGIAARGSYDLDQHSKFVGKPQDYFDEEAKLRYVPHVIEPSAGLDRLALAVLCAAFHEEETVDEKGKKEVVTTLKLHPKIAPIKVGIFPLLKNKPELVSRAKDIYRKLSQQMNAFYDESGSIGRRYARQDEVGTPFCITVDFETLEGIKEGDQAGQLETVTLRHRDSKKQERIPTSELLAKITELIG
ncbi:MAG: glycine--tRNA ligase [Blastochloris sp.]|nr:glycine--tRNA ligase [Blastochloris sp.]